MNIKKKLFSDQKLNFQSHFFSLDHVYFIPTFDAKTKAISEYLLLLKILVRESLVF